MTPFLDLLLEIGLAHAFRKTIFADFVALGKRLRACSMKLKFGPAVLSWLDLLPERRYRDRIEPVSERE